MRTAPIIFFFLCNPFCGFSSDNFKAEKKRVFSDVQCLLLINYPKGISSGINHYQKYFIEKRERDFLIEAVSGHKAIYPRTVPLALNETAKTANKVISDLRTLHLNEAILDHYVSEKQSYIIDDTTYLIYKHINYNCYDPFCGNKHSHTTFVTGETYFSPDFGILVGVAKNEMQFDILFKMKEKKVPHKLIIQILKNRNTEDKIIQEYIRKISE